MTMVLRQRILRLSCVALALALSAPASAQQEERRVKDKGFAFEVHMGTRLIAWDIGDAALSLNDMDGGFFAGAKIRRVIVGAGLDIQRAASGSEIGGVSTSQSDTSLIFMPGVRVAIVRSADERVELYGEFDFGLGHIFTDSDDGNIRFLYQIGPGLRLWFHPQLALGAFMGLRGDFLSRDTGGDSSTSWGLTSIFASFNFLGVF